MTADTPAPPSQTARAEPESFRARSLGVSLTVKDLNSSVAWYRDVVGFTVDRNMEREGKLVAVALKAGDVHILLNHDNGAKGWERTKGEGLSLMYTTTQRVDDVADRIKASGGSLLSEPADMPWGARVFTVLDPDGFKLAFSSEG
ncbi:MAG: VOC family protein [Gemmatimonadaceae bacterium]|nr:VOC family protein [Gemmatimonadaceae bacterium]